MKAKWATIQDGGEFSVALSMGEGLFLPRSGRGITLLEVISNLSLKEQLKKEWENKIGNIVTHEEITFAPLIPHPEKVICIGLNYLDHAKEIGGVVPKEPVIFGKFPSALTGHRCPIVIPKVSCKVDFEIELVLVVGKTGRYIPTGNAWNHIVGLTIGNDVSARDWQLEKDGKQWMIGKSFDTFAPVGPFLTPNEDVPTTNNLEVCLKLNGAVMQQSRTNQFLFSIPQIINYVSQVVTLKPGDLIFTGTPAGVGIGRNPPVWLKSGDELEASIEGLGTLCNTVIDE
jgi:2-keto-4-pentenoate hydratase/2-oxohepta-3-ene-1,7-dioic acid hydratase in catechol pathway